MFVFMKSQSTLIVFPVLLTLLDCVEWSQQWAECGQNTATFDPDDGYVRIIVEKFGGTVIGGRGSWPWLASLGRFRGGKWKHICGGSLVTEKHVLSAAHCVVPDVTAVRLGDGNLSDNVGIQRRLIVNHTIHPKYQTGQSYYDVAVLTLNQPAETETKYVGPICLPKSASEAIDEFEGHQMDVAGYEFGGSGSCKGDSGGPLMRFTSDEYGYASKYIQHGIIQGGIGSCGSKDFPSIYIRIKDPEIYNFIKGLLNTGVQGKKSNALVSRTEGNLSLITKVASDHSRVTFPHSIKPLGLRKRNLLAKTLGMAALHNDTEMVRSILVENYDTLEFVNNLTEDDTGVFRTPIGIASNKGYTEVVKILVTIGKADPDVKDSNGYSPLFKAVENGHLDVVKILVETSRAEVDLDNGPGGFTALMETIYNPTFIKHEIFLYLVYKVGNIDAQNFKGFTALHYATEREDQFKVRILLDAGADPNLKYGDNGWTALMTASDIGTVRIVKLLIEKGGADPDLKCNKLGKTAVHLASFKGRGGVVDYLITQANANANLKDNDGFTPLYLAAQEGSDYVIRILVEKAKVHVNSKNGNALNSIPLTIASQNGHVSTVRYLLAHGAQTHVDYLNSKLISPLYAAAQEGRTDVVKILVEIGNANIEITNTDQRWTALHVAAQRGYLDIVRYLIETAGANGNSTTGNGTDTPLTLAEKYGHDSVARYLSDVPSQPTTRSRNNDYINKDGVNFESRPGDRVFFQ